MVFELTRTNNPQNKQYRRFVIKISIIFFCFSIILLIHAYRTAYPLTLTETTGYIYQIPLSFWLALVIGIIALILLTIHTNSMLATFAAVWGFFLLLNSREILYFNLDFSDNSTVTGWTAILSQSNTLPSVGSPEYFTYLQWPYHHLLTKYIQSIGNVGIMTTMEIGYLAYISLFSISVSIFAYVYITKNNPFYLFSGACLYLVIVFIPLNNQFVPQFLALILLIFLFSIHNKRGMRWWVLKFWLFVSLVMTHGMFWIFYLLAVALEPMFIATKNSVNEGIWGEKSVYGVVLNISRQPSSTLNFSKLIYEFRNLYLSNPWLLWFVSLITIYFTLLLYRFFSFQSSFFAILVHQDPGDQINPFVILSRIIPDPIRNNFPFLTEVGQTGGGDEVAQGRLLYELASAELYLITRNGSIAVIFSIFSLLILSHLVQKYRFVSPFNLAILATSVGYFSLSAFLPILGNRALQVAFLPFITAVATLREKSSLSTIIITILLVSSLFLVANIFVNQSLSGGGATEDFHTTVAGETLKEYSTDKMFVPHENSLPVKSNRINSFNTIRDRTSNSDRGLIVYGPIVGHQLQNRGYECNFTTQHVVYDNTAKGYLIDSSRGEFICEPTIH